MIKKEKIKNAYDLKNKRRWISYLTKSASVELTEEEIRNIEN